MEFLVGDSEGGGENESLMCVVSSSRTSDSESGCSHGGGMTFALRWRFSSSASHKGRRPRCGGMSAWVGPCMRRDKYVDRSLWSALPPFNYAKVGCRSTHSE